jgi:hypothetical protein
MTAGIFSTGEPTARGRLTAAVKLLELARLPQLARGEHAGTRAQGSPPGLSPHLHAHLSLKVPLAGAARKYAECGAHAARRARRGVRAVCARCARRPPTLCPSFAQVNVVRPAGGRWLPKPVRRALSLASDAALTATFLASTPIPRLHGLFFTDFASEPAWQVRDRGLHSISARFTYDGGHFSCRSRRLLSRRRTRRSNSSPIPCERRVRRRRVGTPRRP